MTLDRSLKIAGYPMIALAFIISASALATDISTDPLTTYSAASGTDVKPNVMFVLDNSGSMDWDFMPDWACATSYSTRNPNCDYTGQDPSSPRHEYLFRNSSYNGVYYNPAVVYKPPIMIGPTGAFDTTTYPSMTGMAPETGADATTKPNWRAIKDDAYGVQSTLATVSNLQTTASKPPHVYTTIAGEYCSTPSLRTCITAPAPATVGGVNYRFPAKLRWCDSSALTNCRAAFGGSFTYARSPSPRTTSFTVSSITLPAAITSIKVNSLEILPATVTAATTTASDLAAAIATAINSCNGSVTGNCGVAGYAAVASGSTVTITAGPVDVTTPAISKSGSVAVSNPSAFSTSPVLGYSVLTIIKPGSTPAYAYPGSARKADSRTDCAGTLCTGNEEMTNYANWWTYYKSRMQTMKTAASHAFATIDTAVDIGNNLSRFRLGYMTINSTSGNFINLDEFKTAHKNAWFTKLFSANPSGGTPLRRALSTAGRLYAGKLNGASLSNGSTVADPLQYSCQQNYTILSTDGFWNESDSEAVRMDGSTRVANQDASLPRPYYDGGTPAAEQRTSRLQSITGQLQMRTMRPNGNWRSWDNATSCQPGPAAQCRYVWGTWGNASSCTVNISSGAGVWSINRATDCQYTPWSQWSTVASCVPVAQSTRPNYAVGTARECQPGGGIGGTTDTLADVAAYYYNTDLRSDAVNSTTGPCISPTSGNNVCADNVPASGRDVATWQHMTTFTLGLGAQGQMIYAPNDGKDYWNDNTGDFYDVKTGTTPNAGSGVCSWQIGGSCNWPTPSGNSNANIDDMWHAAINGHGAYFSATDPASLSTSLSATLKAIMNVPRPGTAAAAASSNPNVSASDNYVFSSSYKSIEWYGELIRQRITESGTLTAQNWSAMKLVDCSTTDWKPSNNYVVGNVFRHGTTCYSVNQAYRSGTSFDGTATGVDVVNTEVVNVDESAETKVPVTAPISRTIYTKGTISGSTGLISFDWTTLGSAGLTSYFTAPQISYVSANVGLSQFCPSGGNCLSAAAQSNNTIATGGAAGEALVNFLRGDRTFEGTYFRQRVHVLGDIVSSEARYVQAPLFNYSDANYSAFKTAKTSRSGSVYVGANDGMLHAFDATTGRELWAYIPSMILPDLYKLADKEYSTKHQFFVDSSPETGDICPNAPGSTCTASQWKTILVAGLNRGGKGYYALDITDPASPRLLWEFADATLGYTYNNPRITKLKDGTWVVLVSSGYNNADGVGRLYVLNANTGAVIRTISTGVGTAAAPSGLARISAHSLQPMTDNTSTAAYGGDTLGNLWRFDINGDIGASGYEAHRLMSFTDDAGNPQPITVKPLEATINGKPVIFAGTGRFLGVSDVGDQRTQSFYAVMDKLDQTTYGNPRAAGSNFVKQTLTSSSCPETAPTSVCNPGELVRLTSNNPVDWTTNNGWYMDFLSAGERASTDPALGLGTLLFTTITPRTSALSVCGAADSAGTGSFVYALDYLTGGAVAGTDGVAARFLGTGLVTRPVMIEQSDGTVRALIRASTGVSNGTDLGSTIVITPPVKPSSGSGTRRVSWRVLTSQ